MLMDILSNLAAFVTQTHGGKNDFKKCARYFKQRQLLQFEHGRLTDLTNTSLAGQNIHHKV